MRSYFKVWFTDDGVIHETQPSGFSLSPQSGNRIYAMIWFGPVDAYLQHGLRKHNAVQFMNQILIALRRGPEFPDGRLPAELVASIFGLEDWDTAQQLNPHGN
jgi:hypothetical protein